MEWSRGRSAATQGRHRWPQSACRRSRGFRQRRRRLWLLCPACPSRRCRHPGWPARQQAGPLSAHTCLAKQSIAPWCLVKTARGGSGTGASTCRILRAVSPPRIPRACIPCSHRPLQLVRCAAVYVVSVVPPTYGVPVHRAPPSYPPLSAFHPPPSALGRRVRHVMTSERAACTATADGMRRRWDGMRRRWDGMGREVG